MALCSEIIPRGARGTLCVCVGGWLEQQVLEPLYHLSGPACDILDCGDDSDGESLNILKQAHKGEF